MSLVQSFRRSAPASSALTERWYGGARSQSPYPTVKTRSLPRSQVQTHPSPGWRRLLPTCSSSIVFLLLLGSCLTTTSLFLLLAFIAAPIVTALMMACLCLAVMFVLTESSALGIWHHNRESENRFWILVTVLFTASLLFASDSPLSFGLRYPVLAAAVIVGAALCVNHYDRQLSRSSLLRTPHLRRVSSLLVVDQQRAKAQLRLINEALAGIDFKFVLLKGIRSSDITAKEALIVSTFEEASEDELNYLVTNVNLSLLLYKLKDSDVMTWKSSLLSRTRILHLLCISKLPLLHTAARVNLIDALMQLRLKAHLHAEEWICNILLNTHGRGLIRLKTACDAKGSISNLHKLVFRDIHSAAIRQRILSHLATEASLLNSEEAAHGRRTVRRKILSDVDDTLFSSGGKFPAGVDMSYPARTVYPGVLTFYKELDLGVSASGEWHSGRLGNLVFLSARPHIYKDKAESHSYLHFEQLRMQKGIGLHCVPTLLAGSLDSGWRMVFRGDFHALAATKYDNFVQFAELYPDFTFVFIGDNGQGDVMAAAMMREKLGARLEAVFIKLVQPLHLTPGYSAAVAKEQWRDFLFFATFVGAAVDAARLGLVHDAAVIRIASHAISRLVEMKDVLNVTDFDARRREMNADLLTANAFLLARGLPILPLIPADNTYPVGAHVYTPFGTGRIIEFEPVSSVYVVALLQWTLTDGSHARLYQHSSEVELVVAGQVGSRVWTPFGTGVLEAIRAPGSVHCVALSWGAGLAGEVAAGAGYAKAFLQACECIEIIAAVGELVHCHPFGYGIVTRYRAEDAMYEVQLRLSGDTPAPAELRLKSAMGGTAGTGTAGGTGGAGLTKGFKGGKGKDKPDSGRPSQRAEFAARRRSSMLYTTGANMRRVSEDEKKQRSCAIM